MANPYSHTFADRWADGEATTTERLNKAREYVDHAVWRLDQFTDADAAFTTDAISGNAIDGGTISNFASTGIDDNATGGMATVTDDGIELADAANTRFKSNAVATASSSADVDLAQSVGGLYILRDGSNGGVAIVGLDSTNTPFILGQSGAGTTFVTAAPAATEVQVKAYAGTPQRLMVRAGSSRDGATIQFACFSVLDP